jgi:Tol biopolymer transport system component
MSPEQARGKRVTKRTDVWAFGCVLYEMLTGRRAFAGDTITDTLAAVLQQEVDWTALPDQTPPMVRRLLRRCLQKDEKNRLHDIGDARLDVEEALNESAATTGAPTASSPSVPMQPPRTRLVTGAGVVVVLGAVIGAWLLWPEPLAAPTVVPLTALPGIERSPSLSPDGNQVAFDWNGENQDNLDIYVQQVGTSTPTRLTSDPAVDVAPAWSPDGTQIAFIRRLGDESAIWLTAPLTPNAERRLASFDWYPPEIGGRPATVSWFPDGKRLAIVEVDAGSRMNGIVVIPTGHEDRRRLMWTPISEGSYLYPRVSPSAENLGYLRCTTSTTSSCHLYVVGLSPDLTTVGSPRQLTTENSLLRGATWTTDGRSLIYASGARVTSSLWRVPVAGGAPERLEVAGDHAAFPSVSSRGTRLAYTRLALESDIWKFDSSGRRPFLSTTLDDRNPQFSPDGKRIVFESRRQGKDAQLWVANADGTNVTSLNDGDRGMSGSPRWSFNSRWIVFDGLSPDSRAILRVDATGGQPTQLENNGALPSWSPDDKWIYFQSSRSGRSEIWRIPADGGKAEKITDRGGSNPLVSPDGKTLYYSKDESLPSNTLFAQPVAGGPDLFAQPVAGGPERKVLASMHRSQHGYFPVVDGIYYLAVPDAKRPTDIEIRFFKLATGTHDTVTRFESTGLPSLTVSPDRKTILYTGTPLSAGGDLMLIENFR